MSEVHVYPVNDLVEHMTDTNASECVCGPLTRPVPQEDGSIGWVIVHNSLDGRERYEGVES